MNARPLSVSVISCLGLLLLVGCEKAEESMLLLHSTAESEVQTMAGIARIASGYVDRKLVWKDYHPGSGGRATRLFKGTLPPPDESHSFRAEIHERPFAVVVYRYGNFWNGTVADFEDGKMKSFEANSEGECLCQIEAEFAFGNALKPSLSCAFPQ